MLLREVSTGLTWLAGTLFEVEEQRHQPLESLFVEVINSLVLVPLLGVRLLSYQDIQCDIDLLQEETYVLEYVLLPSVELSLLTLLQLQGIGVPVEITNVVQDDLQDPVE